MTGSASARTAVRYAVRRGRCAGLRCPGVPVVPGRGLREYGLCAAVVISPCFTVPITRHQLVSGPLRSLALFAAFTGHAAARAVRAFTDSSPSPA